MRQKLFSIIIATYNCGPKLEKTIESVLSQKEALFELIIVDGGSTAETLDIINKYAARLTCLSESDLGVYDAFNKGIRMASGKYLYFLGAGDCLRANILEQLKDCMPGDDFTFVYGKTYFRHRGQYYRHEFTRSDLRTINICHQSIFYERNIFDVIGKYDLTYGVFADWVLNMRCFANGRIRKKYVEHVIADYEGGGLSETQEDLKFKSDFPHLIKTYFGLGHYLLYKARVLRTYLSVACPRLISAPKSNWS